MISVVIPLYQKEATIVRALDSVARAACCDHEIVVVDDGSTDGSVACVEAWMRGRDNVELVHQENRGPSAARNTGICHARYPLIAFLDADDTWMSNHLVEMSSLVAAYPQASFYATAWQSIERDGAPRKQAFGLGTDKKGPLPCFYETMATGPMVASCSSVAAWRENLMRVGGFPERIWRGEDKVTWARLAQLGEVVFSPEITATWHRDAPNRSDVGGEIASSAYYDALREIWQETGDERVRRAANVEWARLCGVIKYYDHDTLDAVNKLISGALSMETRDAR